MFVQVMEGRVADLDGLQAQLATWMSDLRPGADGWLGTTAVVRFESQEAAEANSARAEQGQTILRTYRGPTRSQETFCSLP